MNTESDELHKEVQRMRRLLSTNTKMDVQHLKNMLMQEKERNEPYQFKRRDKPKLKSTISTSLFDLLSGSSSQFHLHKVVSIQDILNSSKNNMIFDPTSSNSTSMPDKSTQITTSSSASTNVDLDIDLLEKCYEASIEDLLLGFTTTESEINQLGSLLYHNLILECSKVGTGTSTTIHAAGNNTNDTSDGATNSHSAHGQKRESKESRESRNSSKSFLELHSKWMTNCVNQEECHSFAFVLVRNVILSLQHFDTSANHYQQPCLVEIAKQKIETVEIMIQMLSQYMTLYNDGKSFQTQWVQIVHLIIEICFNIQNSSSTNSATIATIIALSYYDTNGIHFAQCVSIISSPLMIQRLIVKSNLIPSLMHMLSLNGADFGSETSSSYSDKISSITQNENSIMMELLQKEEGGGIWIDAESRVTEYILSLLRHVILNLYPHSLSHLQVTKAHEKKKKNENDGRFIITLDNLNSVVAFLEADTVNHDNESDIENIVMLLIQPYYHLLDIGINPDLYQLFNPTLGDICSDTIIHLILNGCSQNYTLLEKVMSLLQNLLESIIVQSSTNLSCGEEVEKDRQKNLFVYEREDGGDSNILSLIPSIESLFQIYNHILLCLPWDEYIQHDGWKNHHSIFWERQFLLITSCLRGLLSIVTERRMGLIQVSSWNKSVVVLFSILQRIHHWKQLTLNHEQEILSFLHEYQNEISKIDSGDNGTIETMLLIYCILFTLTKYTIVGENEKLFTSNLTMHYWRSLLLAPRSLPSLFEDIQDLNLFLKLSCFKNDNYLVQPANTHNY